MTTAELRAAILDWRKHELDRIRADLRSGKYGRKVSCAKRDAALIQFEARRMFDEVGICADALHELEKRIMHDLSALTGASVLSPPPPPLAGKEEKP
jgi:hypothetical protein